MQIKVHSMSLYFKNNIVHVASTALTAGSDPRDPILDD